MNSTTTTTTTTTHTHTHIHTLTLFPSPCHCSFARLHALQGGAGGQSPPGPGVRFISEYVSCITLRHLPCRTTLCCTRALHGWRVGVASLAPWQAGSRLRLFMGAQYPPFGGLILRIAPAAVAGGWAVQMGRPDMGCRTTSGEGHGAAQETETRRRHPSCLAVVLLCDRV